MLRFFFFRICLYLYIRQTSRLLLNGIFTFLVMQFIDAFLELLLELFHSVDVVIGGLERCLMVNHHLGVELQFIGQEFVFI